eukprot:Hpha_TRINITY_DN16812_c0_g4::TRINITY_DN16812_c0_g4_i1::g.150009::m.150009
MDGRGTPPTPPRPPMSKKAPPPSPSQTQVIPTPPFTFDTAVLAGRSLYGSNAASSYVPTDNGPADDADFAPFWQLRCYATPPQNTEIRCQLVDVECKSKIVELRPIGLEVVKMDTRKTSVVSGEETQRARWEDAIAVVERRLDAAAKVTKNKEFSDNQPVEEEVDAGEGATAYFADLRRKKALKFRTGDRVQVIPDLVPTNDAAEWELNNRELGNCGTVMSVRGRIVSVQMDETGAHGLPAESQMRIDASDGWCYSLAEFSGVYESQASQVWASSRRGCLIPSTALSTPGTTDFEKTVRMKYGGTSGRTLGIFLDHQLTIRKIGHDSFAALAGLKEGGIVLAVDGVRLRGPDDFDALVRSKTQGGAEVESEIQIRYTAELHETMATFGEGDIVCLGPTERDRVGVLARGKPGVIIKKSNLIVATASNRCFPYLVKNEKGARSWFREGVLQQYDAYAVALSHRKDASLVTALAAAVLTSVYFTGEWRRLNQELLKWKRKFKEDVGKDPSSYDLEADVRASLLYEAFLFHRPWAAQGPATQRKIEGVDEEPASKVRRMY